MLHDVVKAEYVNGYKLKLTFDDNNGGIVDFLPFIEEGGVFEKLKDLKEFKKFRINQELGILTWNDEIDIAPETLYSKATNTPLPEWVN